MEQNTNTEQEQKELFLRAIKELEKQEVAEATSRVLRALPLGSN